VIRIWSLEVVYINDTFSPVKKPNCYVHRSIPKVQEKFMTNGNTQRTTLSCRIQESGGISQEFAVQCAAYHQRSFDVIRN